MPAAIGPSRVGIEVQEPLFDSGTVRGSVARVGTGALTSIGTCETMGNTREPDSVGWSRTRGVPGGRTVTGRLCWPTSGADGADELTPGDSLGWSLVRPFEGGCSSVG